MTQRAITVVSCDDCGKESEVASFVVEVNGDRWEVDLCPEHGKWLEGLAAQLSRVGRRLAKTRTRPMALVSELPTRRRKTAPVAPKPEPEPVVKVPTPGELVAGLQAMDRFDITASRNREPKLWRTCAIDDITFKNRTSRDQHLRTQHGVTGVQYDRNHKMRFACPHEGCREIFTKYVKWVNHANKEGHRP